MAFAIALSTAPETAGNALALSRPRAILVGLTDVPGISA
jgi:hypothetical protein